MDSISSFTAPLPFPGAALTAHSAFYYYCLPSWGLSRLCNDDLTVAYGGGNGKASKRCQILDLQVKQEIYVNRGTDR